jgi:hypothetical protein
VQKRHLLFFLFLSSYNYSYGQDFFLKNSDSLSSPRVVAISSGIGLSWVVGSIGISNLWYADYPKTKFHSFNDVRNWLQMDKMGHVYTANKFCYLTKSLYSWSGLTKKKASMVGSLVGLGLQTTLEVMDGYSAEWGFSWPDMIANGIGTSVFCAQELLWEEQRILLKFSYHPTSYAKVRPAVLGSTFSERFLKDYNGQSYWVSASPGAFFSNSKLPKWLALSIGYSIDGKLVGDQETYFDPSTKITYASSRQLLVSLDLDFSKIPVKRSWVKVFLRQLNHLKFPFPALVFSDGKVMGSLFYF